jgi:hypothetical protein
VSREIETARSSILYFLNNILTQKLYFPY